MPARRGFETHCRSAVMLVARPTLAIGLRRARGEKRWTTGRAAWLPVAQKPSSESRSGIFLLLVFFGSSVVMPSGVVAVTATRLAMTVPTWFG